MYHFSRIRWLEQASLCGFSVRSAAGYVDGAELQSTGAQDVHPAIVRDRPSMIVSESPSTVPPGNRLEIGDFCIDIVGMGNAGPVTVAACDSVRERHIRTARRVTGP
jgi:hypothetical protein